MKRIEISTANKIITPRKKRSKGGSVDYSYFDTAKRTVGGKTIERNIQWYRMWFTYLKLCIELQESGEKIKGRKLKVGKFYDEWQLGKKSLLTVSFDDWWEQKRHLFELPKIESGNNNNEDYFVISVPKNRTKQDLVREFDYFLTNKGKFTNKAKYPFSKNIIPFIRLHIQYNCLVMHYNKIPIKVIMNWCNEKYGDIGGVIQNKEMAEDVVFGFEQSVSRVISKGKDRLLDVAKGIFP